MSWLNTGLNICPRKSMTIWTKMTPRKHTRMCNYDYESIPGPTSARTWSTCPIRNHGPVPIINKRALEEIFVFRMSCGNRLYTPHCDWGSRSLSAQLTQLILAKIWGEDSRPKGAGEECRQKEQYGSKNPSIPHWNDESRRPSCAQNEFKGIRYNSVDKQSMNMYTETSWKAIKCMDVRAP